MDAVKFHTSYSAELSPTGPKVWEIILRSWQVELSTWAVKIRNQPIQKRSCFWYRKLCACNLLTRGLNVVLRYLTSSDFCVAKILWASNLVMCQNRPDVDIIPITRLWPDCLTFCKTCHVISLYWYFKNCQLKMCCECWNTQFITFLQTRSHIMMKSQHNVLHAFSVPYWSEMCGVVGVLTVLLLLHTQ